MHLIHSGNFYVAISYEGGIYNGTRFDHGGIVTDIWKNGHSFCGIEAQNPRKRTVGIGLVSEFGINKVSGYNQLTTDNVFLKIIVGWLIKDIELYSFSHIYPIKKIIRNEITTASDVINYHFDSGIRNGTGIVRNKSLSINEQSQLKIKICLKNIGQFPIHTNESCHDFLSFDGHRVDSSYSFVSEITTYDRQVSRLLSGESVPYYSKLERNQIPNYYNGWNLSSGNISLSEQLSFKPYQVAIWGAHFVFIPETFINIDIEPWAKIV